jgi:hypothetical protein
MLASNIMEILALNPNLSTHRITERLKDANKSASPTNCKMALTRLKEKEYVTNESTTHKIQIDNQWSLSCLGKLVALTMLKPDKLYSFVDQYKDEKFYKMIYVLSKSSKKEFVKLLIDRIFENDPLKIETIALEWYNNMRLRISSMETKRHPNLKTLQDEIKREGFAPINLTKKGFILDSEFTHTRIDRIC